jgi:hypothetical protein
MIFALLFFFLSLLGLIIQYLIFLRVLCLRIFKVNDNNFSSRYFLISLTFFKCMFVLYQEIFERNHCYILNVWHIESMTPFSFLISSFTVSFKDVQSQLENNQNVKSIWLFQNIFVLVTWEDQNFLFKMIIWWVKLECFVRK